MTEIDLRESLTDAIPSNDEWALKFAADIRNESTIQQALRVRAVETTLQEFFGRGKLHGTIHSCVGQELIGVIVGSRLSEFDFVTSNHRCHGHFIGATGNWRGLIDEIVGNADGVCAGIGSSQHLWAQNFISNGQQGGLVPVAAGIALDRKRRHPGSLVVSFIGEGTLGEGVVYETMNLSSLWELPQLIVCENNFYSQSTPQSIAVAGDIAARASAFGIAVRHATVWNPANLTETIDDAMREVRITSRPLFLTVAAYRLHPHSKGDDQRRDTEIRWFEERDPLTAIVRSVPHFRAYYDAVTAETQAYAAEALRKPPSSPSLYFVDQPAADGSPVAVPQQSAPPHLRIGQQLNAFYEAYLRSNERAYFIGEDVADPYGGAFKIAKGLQSAFPDRVLTTQISEAAITGVGIGLAISGNRPLVEIMFGDFMTLALDQLLNNAAKFYHMYDRNLSCPLTVRTPMGGRRGYGPTHSQSLERFFAGIDNTVAISVNSLIDVGDQLAMLPTLACPAIVFENKVDYTLYTYVPPAGFRVERDGATFPTIAVTPQRARPTLTIVSYGGIARLVADHLLEIFDEADAVPELLVPTTLHPLDMAPLIRSAKRTGRTLIVEEGTAFGGPGAEMAARLAESTTGVAIRRIGAQPFPIPSAPSLEDEALPGIRQICDALRGWEAR
jgi:2-oxoisovalerate dehydrogenase E1 component